MASSRSRSSRSEKPEKTAKRGAVPAGAAAGGPSGPPKRIRPPTRDEQRDAAERSLVLAGLPSLAEHPVPDLEAAERAQPVVDLEAAPPPAPPPWPEPDGFVDRGLPIPEQYGMDRVVALVRDPQWLYVYWELSGGALERVRFQYSQHVVDDARWALRVHATPRFTPRVVDIDRDAGNWYLRVAPEGRYRIELGFYTPDGNFTALCASAEVQTPSGTVSPLSDERWMVRKRDLEALLTAGGLDLQPEAAPGSSGSEQVMQFQRMEHPRAGALFSGMAPPPPPLREGSA